MTEVPEHLLRRAKEARERLEDSGESAEAPAAPDAGPPPAEPSAAEPAAGDTEKIPAHLLDRSRSAAEQAAMAPAAPGGPVAPAPPSLPTGPGGHTQRLLTVVKSGSIQDVKAMPQDRVHVWPHLLLGEFVASLFITAFLLIFSVFVNAPLLELANVNETPNPSKAPWYFLGLQELLTMFHPMVAGVTIPGIASVPADPGPLHRPQQGERPREAQVRSLADDRAPHVLGDPGHDRLVLPRSGLQLHLPVARRAVLRLLRYVL